MVMTRQQRVMILVLALYWPTLFVLAHIPVPRVVQRAGMSDKSLHVLMYMILTFLFWSAVKGPVKVRWGQRACWLTLTAMLAYAVCDEYLQRFVAGRSMDALDLVADGAGAVMALALLSVVSFRPGLLIVIGATIYTLTVFPRANLTQLLPVMTTVFHLAAYGLFTLLWIFVLRSSYGKDQSHRRWLVATLGAPLGLLLVTKVSALIAGKALAGWDVGTAMAGILGTVTITCLLSRSRGKTTNSVSLSGVRT